MKENNKDKLQESVQKALLGKLNESFWDSDEFPYNLDDYPEYTPESVGAKQLFRQLLKNKGFKTKYFDEEWYEFDEPWLDVERNGIEDSFDIYYGGADNLYLVAGNEGTSGTDNNLEKIGYENQDKMQLGYTKEFNTIENLDRICIAIDKNNYESELVDIVKKLDHDFKVAEDLTGSNKENNTEITDADIENAIKIDLEKSGGIFTDDSAYDVAEDLTGISDISKLPDGLIDRIRNILHTKFDKAEESKKVESKDTLKLSDSDIEYLKKIGHTEEDIQQIEEALNNTIYKVAVTETEDFKIEIPDESADTEISAQEARDILGDDRFLSGLSRSAFHYTSGRYNYDETLYVSFDSSKIFEENKKLKTEDAISLEFTDYIVEGEAILNLWGGGQGRIVMDSYHIDEVTPEEICSNANDGQFGCESIEGIEGTIYKNYSGHAVYYKDFEYMGEDFIKYSGSNAKRGIKTENKVEYGTQYEVIDENGETIIAFDREEEAIQWALDNKRGVKVERVYTTDVYKDDGEFMYKDLDGAGIVWEREHTKTYKYEDEMITESESDLSEIAERSRKLRLMDLACRSINDEDYVDIWLYDGCPDESTQEDYDEIAEDEDEYNRMEALFKKLMKYAVADGLYDCPEEAYKYALQFEPKLQNLK